MKSSYPQSCRRHHWQRSLWGLKEKRTQTNYTQNERFIIYSLANLEFNPITWNFVMWSDATQRLLSKPQMHLSKHNNTHLSVETAHVLSWWFVLYLELSLLQGTLRGLSWLRGQLDDKHVLNQTGQIVLFQDFPDWSWKWKGGENPGI